MRGAIVPEIGCRLISRTSLSRVFRGKMVAGLWDAFHAGTLTLPRDLRRLTNEPAFAAWLRTLFRHEWVVYAKLRRFCLHVLPKGFVRIRFYGFLAPRCRTDALPRCRQALGANAEPVPTASVNNTSTRVSLPPCPTCGGLMVAVERLTVRQLAVQAWIEGLALDSS